jgi:hypothetical protein
MCNLFPGVNAHSPKGEEEKENANKKDPWNLFDVNRIKTVGGVGSLQSAVFLFFFQSILYSVPGGWGDVIKYYKMPIQRHL